MTPARARDGWAECPDVPTAGRIIATVTIDHDEVRIEAERTGTFRDCWFDVIIHKADVQAVAIALRPDVPDDFEYSPWNQPEYSTATISHNDPDGVVPAFHTVLSSDKSYWIKALAKLMKEKLLVEVRFEDSKGERT